MFQANYTWGHAINFVDNSDYTPNIQSFAYMNMNRASTGFDRRHNLGITSVWEVPLGKGQVNIQQFVKTLQKVGYRGPLCIEREVGNQEERVADIAHGIQYLNECLAK